MHVLVTTATRHGAAAGIGQAIAETLAESGLQTTVLPPEEVSSVASFDAVVLGSAIYMGQWLEPARALVSREAAALATRPVWLFSSGPVGDPPVPAEEPAGALLIAGATKAREHRVFGGVLDRSKLGFGEKLVSRALRVAEGDYRPWDEIRAWARGIAADLAGT